MNTIIIKEEEEEDQSPRYKWFVLTMLTIVSVFAFIDRQLIIILQEAIKEDLGLTDSQLGFVSGLAFSLLYIVAVIPIARIADRSSRTNIIVISLSIWSFITALTGFAANYIQLALARIGVGLGEAGAVPASHSIIADYFPQEKRSVAYSIHSLGIYIGLLFGFALGGILQQAYGWRAAFYIIGIPGLLFSFVFFVTVKEPARKLSNFEKEDTDLPKAKEVLYFLLSKKTFVYLAIAAVLHSFVGSAFANWMPPFLSRIHHMTTVEIGLWLAFAIGICGGLGTYLGGYLGDKLGKIDMRWYVWLPAISIIISLPFAFVLLLANNKLIALIAYTMPNILYAIFLGPTYALVQSMVGSRMRALASAIVMVLISLLGMGLGPYLTGILSDYLSASYGVQSIRWSLLMVGFLDIIAALFFYLAATVVRNDVMRK